MRHRLRKRLGRDSAIACAMLWAAAAFNSPAAAGASDDPLEYRVKAAFLFNFARFVTWPASRFASDSSPVELCVVGADAFREVLEEAVAGKTAAERPLHVRRITRPDELPDCHLAYIVARTPSESERLLSLISGHSVLSVYERASPLATGVVRFYLDDRHVQFEINAAAAEREGLKVSSKLLAVARVVDL